MKPSRRLELVVPCLLGPVTDADAVARLQPALPALAECLARGDRLAETGDDGLAPVFGAFGFGPAERPAAAVSRHGEADAERIATTDHWWLRADPVHLRVDTTHARLFGGYALQLESDEADRLVERLNAFFAEDGLVFEAPAADRWYLALERAQDLQVQPPDRVAGRNVDAFMPEGEDARAWRAWLNEVQMLLHDAPVNAERERRGALPVNSLWVWGGGSAPRPGEGPARVWSDDPVARGLARLAGVAVDRPPAHAPPGDWPAGTTLVMEPAAREALVHGDIEGWLECLAALERHWFAPALDALRARRLDELVIAPSDGRRFRVRRGALRRFWRRRRPWTHWLRSEQ